MAGTGRLDYKMWVREDGGTGRPLHGVKRANTV